MSDAQTQQDMKQHTKQRTTQHTKIDVRGLDLYYGGVQALKNVSITFGEQEIHALIGPSGCGKSTLLRSLNRMNDLIAGCRVTGQVLLDGVDVYGRRTD